MQCNVLPFSLHSCPHCAEEGALEWLPIPYGPAKHHVYFLNKKILHSAEDECCCIVLIFSWNPLIEKIWFLMSALCTFTAVICVMYHYSCSVIYLYRCHLCSVLLPLLSLLRTLTSTIYIVYLLSLLSALCNFTATASIIYLYGCCVCCVPLLLSLASCTFITAIYILFFYIVYFYSRHLHHVLLPVPSATCTFTAAIYIVYLYGCRLCCVPLQLPSVSCTFTLLSVYHHECCQVCFVLFDFCSSLATEQQKRVNILEGTQWRSGKQLPKRVPAGSLPLYKSLPSANTFYLLTGFRIC